MHFGLEAPADPDVLPPGPPSRGANLLGLLHFSCPDYTCPVSWSLGVSVLRGLFQGGAPQSSIHPPLMLTLLGLLPPALSAFYLR